MITTAIILGVGSIVGGALGWKLGRTYERVRGGKKGEPEKAARGGKDRTSR
jgi:membrane protein YqaA with SNARE-associated domain